VARAPIRWPVGLALAGVLAGVCSDEPAGPAAQGARVPNPAHARCIADGYQVEPVLRDGVPVDAECVAPATGARCPVWDYFRGDCLLPGGEGPDSQEAHGKPGG